MDADNPVMLCDLGILTDQAAEPVTAQNPGVGAQRVAGQSIRQGVGKVLQSDAGTGDTPVMSR